jgi:uncharacterized protein
MYPFYSSEIDVTRTLAIDLDSVLADTMKLWTAVFSRINKTRITKDEITSWDITKILPISAAEISNIFIYVWTRLWKDIPPSEPNLADIVNRIHKKGYRISILTKRERPTVSYVANWLDYHDIFSDDLIFVYDGTPKANYQFDILVDDAPVNMIDITPPKMGILFNQPWNVGFNWPIRVSSLSQMESKL